MTITPDMEARIKAALTPADYQALVDEINEARSEARSARLAASTEKARADQNWATLARVKEAGKRNTHLAQIGYTIALRLANPHLTYGEEREARQTLIDAHLNEGA